MIGALGKGMLTIADGPEMPSVDDFLPDPFVFQGTPFAINRIILVRILATVIMLLVLGITASRAKLIPSRWQGAVEWLIEFVRDNIVYQVMGELRGQALCADDHHRVLHVVGLQSVWHHPRLQYRGKRNHYAAVGIRHVVLLPILDCRHS